jgi:hypothetical protein
LRRSLVNRLSDGRTFPRNCFIAALITCNGILSRSRESSREENSILVPAWGGQKSWTAYCRQQAVESASAATTANLGEVRQAYLNIEQAWLQWAPDINSDRDRKKKAARLSTATECEGRL